MNIEQLLKGKPTKIRSKEYLPTKAYVEPFLEKMSKFTSDFRVQVKLPDQITRTVDGDVNVDDITYNRVLIEAVLPTELEVENHQEVIGLVYGLDVRKPVAKIYRGALNMACTNLCVFNPSFLNVQALSPEQGINVHSIDQLMSQASDIKLMLNNLRNTEWEGSPQNLESNLGRWVRNAINCEYNTDFGTVKIGSDMVIKAYTSMFVDEESPYYIGEGSSVDMFTVYNAFTQIITDNKKKDMMNLAEKTLLLRNILNF